MTKCQPLRGARGVVGSCSWRTRRFTLALVAALPVILLASCSTLGPDTTAAADVAVAFHRAVQDGDGNAACDFWRRQPWRTWKAPAGNPVPTRSWPRT